MQACTLLSHLLTKNVVSLFFVNCGKNYGDTFEEKTSHKQGGFLPYCLSEHGECDSQSCQGIHPVDVSLCVHSFIEVVLLIFWV